MYLFISEIDAFYLLYLPFYFMDSGAWRRCNLIMLRSVENSMHANANCLMQGGNYGIEYH